jgi:hypothetical protein
MSDSFGYEGVQLGYESVEGGWLGACREEKGVDVVRWIVVLLITVIYIASCVIEDVCGLVLRVDGEGTIVDSGTSIVDQAIRCFGARHQRGGHVEVLSWEYQW